MVSWKGPKRSGISHEPLKEEEAVILIYSNYLSSYENVSSFHNENLNYQQIDLPEITSNKSITDEITTIL